MAIYPAVGAGPISFLDSKQSQQEIPLSAIQFVDGSVNATAWPYYIANQAVVDALLQQLISQGFLAPAAKTPTPSLTITAAQQGPAGNDITVRFTNPSSSAGTVDVTVATTQVYTGLTPDNIETTLGKSAITATGLVFVSSNNHKQPQNFAGNFSGGSDLVVPDTGGNPDFTLTTTSTSPDAAAIQIGVALDPAPATTFTLTASWTKSQTAVPLASLEGGSNPFVMLVNFSGASGGPLPAPGTVTLAGGAAATSTSAVAANVVAFSSS